LFSHALAGDAGNGWPQLMIVSRLAGRPTVAIWMHVGGGNYIIAPGGGGAAHLHLRPVTQRTIIWRTGESSSPFMI